MGQSPSLFRTLVRLGKRLKDAKDGGPHRVSDGAIQPLERPSKASRGVHGPAGETPSLLLGRRSADKTVANGGRTSTRELANRGYDHPRADRCGTGRV